MEREVGGGIGMGNTCKPMAVLFQCMTKFTTKKKKKNPPANAGDLGSIPALARSPGGGRGNPLQYSCLGNRRDRAAWRATAHGVAEGGRRLSHITATPVHEQGVRSV